MTREEAVLKAINENVRIRPTGFSDGRPVYAFDDWYRFNFDIPDNVSWEAEPQQVTNTLEQLEKAFYNCLGTDDFALQQFKKELGFK